MDCDDVNLPLSATDSAGHPLTYSATNLPDGLTIDSSSRRYFRQHRLRLQRARHPGGNTDRNGQPRKCKFNANDQLD